MKRGSLHCKQIGKKLKRHYARCLTSLPEPPAGIVIEFPQVIWTGDGFTGSESWVVDFQDGMTDHAKNKSRLVTLMVSSSPN